MARRRMRMAELARLSGVPRETIHYYLREGLLPPPERSGKTSAYYDETHLERLGVIRKLRDEKYLPVAVIRSILKAGLEAGLGRDLDTLSDVLAIEPTLEAPVSEPGPADSEILEAARRLGLIHSDHEPSDDPTERRVLGAVSEALALGGDATALTLADIQASAPAVAELVDAEAAQFFDFVVAHGEMRGAVLALRAGRGAVARFLTAYRDWMLRRIVDDLLSAIGDSESLVTRARALPLAATRLRRLGAEAHGNALHDRARRGDPAAANDWVWHVFALGSRRPLIELSSGIREHLRPRAAFLCAVAAAERGAPLAEAEGILAKAGAFPLGEVLLAELLLLRALERDAGDAGVLERAVPALHRLFGADPGRDADPLASGLGFLRRGLIGLALPRALGRSARALVDLEQALSVLLSAPGRVHPAVVARIEGNARLGLGRALSGSARDAEARAQLGRAQEIDPSGPIGHAAAELLEPALPTEILAEARAER